MALLGELLEKGQGGLQDHQEAAHWYSLAALQGDNGAMARLGILYSAGRGVRQSLVTAYFWFNLAAARGHKEAAERRDFLATVLEPAALARAQLACGIWKPIGH